MLESDFAAENVRSDSPREDPSASSESPAPAAVPNPNAVKTGSGGPRVTPRSSGEVARWPAVESAAHKYRGVGFLAAMATATLCGFGDGVVALIRSPSGARHFGLSLWVLFHAAALFASGGLFIGIAQEIFVQAAARRPRIRAGAAWLLGGPGRWFAADPGLSITIAIVAMIVVPTVGMVFQVGWYVVNFFHSHLLMATAVMLSVPILIAATGAVALLIAWPLEWVVRRVGRLASPGMILSIITAIVSIQIARFVRLHWLVYRNIDGRPAVVLAVTGVIDLLGLVLIGRILTRKFQTRRIRVVAAAVLAAMTLFLVSGLTLGARHAVLSTLLQRSLVTGYLIRPLQRVVDIDRDGYGPLFGGGDCDDFNPARHPGARDIAGNGIDENCSGADARSESEAGTGRMGELPESLRGSNPSIVFLSIDALRPDHSSAYGYHRPTTPNIERWARANATRFTHAYCTSPRSLRSFASVFTGQYPSGVAWGADNMYPALEASNTTLAEVLRDRGYATAAFVNAYYFGRTAGFFQGFAESHEGQTFKDDAEPTVRGAIDWLNARDQDAAPFFAWIHLMEPHDDYRDLTVPVDFGHSPMDTYDEEIARADMFAGRILTVLDDIATRRPLIVVLFSDHGEAFGEHDYLHHSYDLHEEAVRVMLFIRAPGAAPGDRAALTSLMDLYPTMLNYVGANASAPIPSRSLLRVLLGDPRPIRERLFTEVTPDGIMPAEKRAVLDWPYKLLYDFQRGSWELYNLARDPGETNNLYDSEQAIAEQLRERLLNWMDSNSLLSNNTAALIAAHRLASEPPMQHPVHVRFGDVDELLGFDQPQTRYRVGESVQFTMYHRVLGQTEIPAWLAVTFEREDGQGFWPHFHISHYPINGRYLTTQWIPGEILRDEMTRVIEPEVAPGRYRVLFSIEHLNRTNRYYPNARARPAGELEIGTIEIVP